MDDGMLLVCGLLFVVYCFVDAFSGCGRRYRMIMLSSKPPTTNHQPQTSNHPLTDKKSQMLQLIRKNCIYLCCLHTCEGLSDSRGAFIGFEPRRLR